MNIYLLYILFGLLITLFILNQLCKPNKHKRQYLESFFDTNCDKSNTVDSIRSCYTEVVKGKMNYINQMENKLKNISSKNTSDIDNIKKQIDDINNSIMNIKKNVENSTNLLKTTQQDIFSKANQTTEILQKAQEYKDNAVNNSYKYQ